MKDGRYDINEPRSSERDAALREEIAPYGLASLGGSVGLAEVASEWSAGDFAGEAGASSASDHSEMIRTQVYLTSDQREFLQREGKRTGVSMAEALRRIILEKMQPSGPEVAAWLGNPLLEEVEKDPSFMGTGSTDLDAGIYGSYSAE
ncbi:MAG: hypothetical protein ACPG32_04675 [Akkermansiaceae bacterium]